MFIITTNLHIIDSLKNRKIDPVAGALRGFNVYIALQ